VPTQNWQAFRESLQPSIAMMNAVYIVQKMPETKLPNWRQMTMKTTSLPPMNLALTVAMMRVYRVLNPITPTIARATF
jgi:hypothetical protein